MTEAFAWDYGQTSERWTSVQETKSILSEIHDEIVKNNGSLLYSHTVSVWMYNRHTQQNVMHIGIIDLLLYG